jgi:hypothetical protein
MACLTVHIGVYSRKGKTGLLVALGHFALVIPLTRQMALRAGPSKLAAVHIKVAATTLTTRLIEDQSGVASQALHLRVPSFEWKARSLMIERGMGFDRPPPFRGVAIIAIEDQCSVRTVSRLVLRQSRVAERGQEK